MAKQPSRALVATFEAERDRVQEASIECNSTRKSAVQRVYHAEITRYT
jgi:hypothetical protein